MVDFSSFDCLLETDKQIYLYKSRLVGLVLHFKKTLFKLLVARLLGLGMEDLKECYNN